ncbi:MAG TPA: (2Fe-2S)-binding protein [Kofleriaceae bacterium]|nr:(2Fe-2S)-binding protein [Kofleriaceae bacterium]
MSKKILLCRCEDVTLHDVEHAIEQGYRDLEEIKRYTGFGTGPCQGKECLGPMALALLRLTGAAPAAIAPFTARPPFQPTPLRLFAMDPAAHRFADDTDQDQAADDDDHEGGP